jgi:hypothetical protein
VETRLLHDLAWEKEKDVFGKPRKTLKNIMKTTVFALRERRIKPIS